MKKILALIFSVSLLFISCEGDQGPPGPPGLDGGLIVGQMFERTVDFTPGNDFGVLIDIPPQIEVLETDIILVHTRIDVVGGETEVWEPLPQSYFFEDETLIYKFSYTPFDVDIFLDGTVILDDLPTSFTQGIKFRIIVLPADKVVNIDLNKMESLMEAVRLKDVEELN